MIPPSTTSTLSAWIQIVPGAPGTVGATGVSVPKLFALPAQSPTIDLGSPAPSIQSAGVLTSITPPFPRLPQEPAQISENGADPPGIRGVETTTRSVAVISTLPASPVASYPTVPALTVAPFVTVSDPASMSIRPPLPLPRVAALAPI